MNNRQILVKRLIKAILFLFLVIRILFSAVDRSYFDDERAYMVRPLILFNIIKDKISTKKLRFAIYDQPWFPAYVYSIPWMATDSYHPPTIPNLSDTKAFQILPLSNFDDNHNYNIYTSYNDTFGGFQEIILKGRVLSSIFLLLGLYILFDTFEVGVNFITAVVSTYIVGFSFIFNFYLTKATTDSLIFLLIVFSLWASHRTIISLGPLTLKRFIWTILWSSMVGGIAVSTKLNGFLTFVNYEILLLVILSLRRIKFKWFIAGNIAFVLGVALCYCLIHPYVFFNPKVAFQKTVDHNVFVVKKINLDNPKDVFPKEKYKFISKQVFTNEVFIPNKLLPLKTYLIFISIGLLTLFRLRLRIPTASLYFLLCLMAVINMIYMPLNWERYYVFILLLVYSVFSLGLAEVTQAVFQILRKFQPRYMTRKIEDTDY